MNPQVLVNCAMSVDGKVALPDGTQIPLSCEEDMERVHLLRNECDAVMVGIGTVLADDPKLTVKEKYVPEPNQPLRVVLDSKLQTPKDANVLDGRAPTLIATTLAYYQKIEGAEVVACGDGERVDLNILLNELGKRGMKKLLVEGGGTVIFSLLQAGLVSELRVYISSIIIGGEGTPTMARGKGVSTFSEGIGLELVKVERLGEGVLLGYKKV